MIRLVFILSLFFVFPVMAQGLRPLPTIENMDFDAFTSQSQTIHKEFETGQAMNFKIQIPSNFIVKPDGQLKTTASVEGFYGELFHAYGPTVYDLRPYVTFNSFKLDRIISPKNWFVSRVLRNNYTLRGIETNKEDTQFEAFYVRLDGYGRSEVARAKGFLHGEDLVMIEYVVPIKLFEKEKDNQIHSINTFEFENDYEIVPPEDFSEYEYLEVFAIKYPKSWFLNRKGSKGINDHNIAFKTSDKRGFLIASVDVSLFSNRSLKDRVDKTIYPVDLSEIIKNKKEELSELGFVTDTAIERKNIDSLGYETDIAVTEVYPLRRKKSDVFINDGKNPIVQEFWMTVIKTPEQDGKNYILSMVGPSRNVDLYNWAVATEAYELMVESVR